jgi:phage regulator Rha-like protein
MTKKTEIAIAELKMTSREIAKFTGKQHKDVLYDIRKMLQLLEYNTAEFSAMYVSSNKQQYEEFHLPKDLTITLVSGYDIVARHKIVTRWLHLEEENLRLKQEAETKSKHRLDTKTNFYVLTDAVKTAKEDEGKEAKSYHYSNEMDLVNQVVLGMEAKTFRRMHALDEKESIRDHMDANQLKAIAAYEKHDYTLLLAGMDYSERKKALINMRTKEVKKLSLMASHSLKIPH